MFTYMCVGLLFSLRALQSLAGCHGTARDVEMRYTFFFSFFFFVLYRPILARLRDFHCCPFYFVFAFFCAFASCCTSRKKRLVLCSVAALALTFSCVSLLHNSLDGITVMMDMIFFRNREVCWETG